MNYAIHVQNVHGEECGSGIDYRLLQPGQCVEFSYSPPKCGTSVKLSKSGDFSQGHFQFEHDIEYPGIWPGMYVDFSDVDGSCAGRAGSAFPDANIIAKAKGVGAETCPILKCFAGQVCEVAYQFPKDDNKTRVSMKRSDSSYYLRIIVLWSPA